jgi:hypothetical protein
MNEELDSHRLWFGSNDTADHGKHVGETNESRSLDFKWGHCVA